MGSGGGELDLQSIFNAIQTLYSPSGPPHEKHAASSYLEEFQKSVGPRQAYLLLLLLARVALRKLMMDSGS